MPIQPTSKIWHNGNLIPWDKAQLHVMSHVVHYGSSVFEGIRCYGQPHGAAVFRLPEHMQRLIDSAKIYRMTLPYSLDQLSSGVVELIEAGGSAAGICDRDMKPLRGQKLREPAAHLAPAADDQRALSRALPLRRNTRRLLCGEGGLDELAQQRFRQIGLEAEAFSRRAAAQDHLPLAREIARGASGGTLDRRHLFAQGFSARHQREELAVEVTQRRAQLVQSHRQLSLHPAPFLLSAHRYRKCGGAATMRV